MIVRILGEGQLHIDDALSGELNQLDSRLEAAVEQADEKAFRAALDELVSRVRSAGNPVDPGALEPSELIIPSEDATMAEVRKLMADDGLIPG
jgi:PspAA-like protein